MHRREFLRNLTAGSLATGFVAQAAPAGPSQLTAAGCCLTNLGFEGTLQKIFDLGFSGVEIATFAEKTGPAGDTYPFAVVDQLGASDRARLKTLVKRFRHVSTHLPYYPDFRPIAADVALREKSRRELLRSVDDSGFWQASVATVHLASEKGLSFGDARTDLIGFYRELGDRAASHGVRIGIETTRPYRVGEYLDLIEAVDRGNVGGTVDVGHIGFFRHDLGVADADLGSARGIQRYNDLLIEVVKGLGPKLFHCHVHDVRARDWQDHHVPGTGIIDFVRLFEHLSIAGYDKLFAAEILYYDGPQVAGLQLARKALQQMMSRV
ncbi:MAG TPA: sugar phosphate isomerase/epimerase family protein [Bryobacteraceae bacterium]|nr:sugar phosphate isomerase/epimerase family protein [Bryobacteraceae bacterium]